MKVKGLLVAAVAAMLSFGANAQAKFISGDMGLNIDYSLGVFNKWDGEKFDDNFTQHGVGASFEYIILEGLINGNASIGAGGQVGVGFGHKKETEVGVEYKTNLTRVRVATRGVFHYAALDLLDTYAGVTLGVNLDKATFKADVTGVGETKTTDSDNIFVAAPFVGARYFFSDGFGVNMELSYDTFALMALGVTFKF